MPDEETITLSRKDFEFLKVERDELEKRMREMEAKMAGYEKKLSDSLSDNTKGGGEPPPTAETGPGAASSSPFSTPRDSLPHFHNKPPIWGADSETSFPDHLKLFQFYLTCTAPNLALLAQKYALINTLKESARAQAMSLKDDVTSNLVSYEVFTKKLTALFCPSEGSEYARVQFISRVQRSGEKISTYLASKLALFKLAYPTETAESRDIYFNRASEGLLHPTLKARMAESTYLSPENYRQETLRWAAIIVKQKTWNCVPGAPGETTTEGLDDPTLSYRLDTSAQEMELGQFTGNCNKCQRPGHKAKFCKSGRPGGSGGGQRSQHGRGRGAPQVKNERDGGGKSKSKLTCKRCGHTGHLVKSCHAKRHVKGYALKQDNKMNEMSNPGEEASDHEDSDDGLSGLSYFLV